MRIRQLPVRRHGRGFTLIEVIVVLALGSVIILMIIGWITSLVNTSASNLEQNAADSGFTYVSTTLAADVTGAVTCAPGGFGVPLQAITTTTLGLYEPDAGGTYDNLVLWQWSSGGTALQRAVITGSAGTCPVPPSAGSITWVTMASNVTAGSFTPWFQGTAGSAPTSGLCTGAAGSTADPTNCYFDALELQATMTNTAGQGSTIPFDQTWTLNLAGSQVTP